LTDVETMSNPAQVRRIGAIVKRYDGRLSLNFARTRAYRRINYVQMSKVHMIAQLSRITPKTSSELQSHSIQRMWSDTEQNVAQ
jgi:hypothetical protein